ncbi:MAG: restriction endonuclease subunit S [Chlorobiaceae bacterium]|nr:restriction endonuclease subunit S [Chlorobiaceae bacterium]
MIADLKPYPEYRESGLPWLGKVPEHWDLIPNRGLMRRRKVLVGDHHTEYKLLSLTKQGVIVRDISSGKGKFSSDMGTSQEVRKGDLVFCLFDVPETPRTVGLSRYDGMITGAYTVFEWLGRGCIDYVELFYRAIDDRKLLSPLYSGLRNTIPAERFLATKTPLPPPNEQTAIARFLGWSNGQLEKAIRAKRKVITLLNEQKQVIIHRAVTRGLDLSVPLKPSGIPWLGDIPEHWEKSRLKIIASNVTEQTSFMSEVDVYVALENVESWSGKVTFQRKQDGDLFTGQVKKFQKNDVLFGKLRPYLAKAFTALVSGVCVGEFFVLRTNSFLCSKFLEHVLHTKAVIDVINSSTFGAKMPRVDWQFMGNLQIPVPPISEQKDIIQKIDIDTLPLHVAISRFEREIELLREYRTRLVADVVTGKLDVREAAAKLPDETMSDLSDNDSVEALEDEPFEEEALV